MKLNTSKQEKLRILEMHLREKNSRVISEQQTSAEQKAVQNLLTHFCLKDKGTVYYVENLQRGNTKYEWVIKQRNNADTKTRYLTLDGHVFEPKDQSKPNEDFVWVDNWSLQPCEQRELDKNSSALRNYYVKNFGAKTLDKWAEEGVEVVNNQEYKKIDYLGHPPLYIDVRIPILKSFNPNSNSGRLWAELVSKGAKFDFELNRFEKQRMEGPYPYEPDADFPNGFKYYLPAAGGTRARGEDKTDIRNAYPGQDGEIQGGTTTQSNVTQNSDPTVSRALDRIRNLQYDSALPNREINECAEVLRIFYEFYRKRYEVNTADVDFIDLKNQAQACVVQLKPSRFSSIFGARGGDVDRDTRKIIQKLTGDIPGIGEQNPYRLKKPRVK